LFAVLEKVHLGADHSDFHTLLAVLTQILEGFIFNTWQKECGFDSLDEFAVSQPPPEQLLETT
jgi:hypothetical protein